MRTLAVACRGVYPDLEWCLAAGRPVGGLTCEPHKPTDNPSCRAYQQMKFGASTR